MDICGSDAIFIPVSECDDCAALLERIRNTYTKSEVDQLLSDLEHVHMHVVNTLPTTGEDNVIYLVPRAGGSYEMWVWADNQWIDLGAEEIDLSDYVKKTQLNTSTNDGLVVKSNGDTEKVWNTGLDGTPAWREDYTRKILGDFANVVEGDVARIEYRIGHYLVKDGIFYKVIANIAPGNAFVVDGNIAQTNVGREVRNLTLVVNDLDARLRVHAVSNDRYVENIGGLKAYTSYQTIAQDQTDKMLYAVGTTNQYGILNVAADNKFKNGTCIVVFMIP